MDPKQRKQAILAGGLGAVALVVVLWQFMAPPPEDPIAKAAKEYAASAEGKKAAAESPGAGAAAAAAAAANRVTLIESEVVIGDLLEKIKQVTFDYGQERIDRNPMAPLIGKPGFTQNAAAAGQGAAGVGDIMSKSITGIVWDRIAPTAVVDDELVTVGHTYDNGVKVYAIEPHRVIFLVGDSLIPVEMKEL